MKKIIYFGIIIALVLGLFGAPFHSVDAQIFSYISGIQVYNLSGTTANISFSYFDSSTGTLNGSTIADTVAPGESKNYYPHPTSAFSGSLLITSDQPLAAISNLQSVDGTARASYVGQTSGATSIYLPTLMTANGQNNTWISIQNTGSTDATVSIDYSDCATNEPSGIVIKPGAAKTINNAVETCHTSKIYSGTISSNQPVAAVAVQEKPGVIYAYSGLKTVGSTNPIMPIATFNNSNNQTGIQIQNTSGSPSDITITYIPSTSGGAGTQCTEKQTVPAGGSVTFGWPAFVTPVPNGYTGITDCARGVRFLGSAKVTGNSANVTINSVVNQAKYGTFRAGSYTAFSPDNGSAKVVFPLIFDRRGNSAKLITAFNIMNVGSLPTNIKCVFQGTSYTYTATLASGEVVTENQYLKIADNYLGSGSCTAYTSTAYTTPDTSAKLVAVVNQVTSLVTNTYDTLMIYEAINTTP